MTREIVLDTETTGLSPREGHRVVEIGCVELINRMPTDRSFHRYVNPQRDMPAEAYAVHGISADFLADKPVFAEVADAFLEFISGDTLVIHNAGFDVGFLNAELNALGKAPITMDRVVDTVMLARRRHPGGGNSLDALCTRYGIDNSRRTKHGALMDAEILSEVYAELLGGRQASLGLAVVSSASRASQRKGARQRPHALPGRLTPQEIAAHRAFVEQFGNAPIWGDYIKESDGA